MTNLMGKIAASFENVLSGKTLDERMVELARARQVEHDTKAALKQVEADMQAQYAEELAVARNAIELATARTEETERVARERAMIEFKAGNSTRPHPQVLIKRHTLKEYDVQVAINYCLKNLPGAIKLNKVAFERDVGKVAWVHLTTEYRPTISKDLSSLLVE